MENSSIHITVMQFGRNERIVDQTLEDLRGMLVRLSSSRLMSTDLFRLIRYTQIASPGESELILELAKQAMTDSISASIHIRSHMFSLLSASRISSSDDFLERIKRHIRCNDLRCSVSHEQFAEVYSRAAKIREDLGLERPLDPPDILWLPARYHPKFDGLHGVSARTLRHGGSCALLCPPRYYYQIVWHECFHLLFGCDDCYDCDTHDRTCSLDNCVMQWNPCYCEPDRGRWFCEGQETSITAGVERLKRRQEQLTQKNERGDG